MKRKSYVESAKGQNLAGIAANFRTFPDIQPDCVLARIVCKLMDALSLLFRATGTWLRGPLRDWVEDLINPASLQRQGILNVAPITHPVVAARVGLAKLGLTSSIGIVQFSIKNE